MRWKVVSWIEIIKVVARLSLLKLSGRRMVTGTVVPERLVDPARSRCGRASATEGNADLGGFVTAEAREPEKVAPALSLIRKYGPMGLAGELLFILRPIIYVLSLRKMGKRDWRPWALSLVVELASRQLIRTDLRPASGSERTVEKDELSRRKWLFLYYLLRSPFFDRFTESRLTRVADWCNNKPLLSLLGALIQDYQPLWQQYYFYTAAS
ncbi:hypothetical protein DL89DRAFT_273868 [Linderina pennispora]|uniref:Peroxisomal membrane protein PEX16 n=1 Tax=Linderina pennispora TaxID=61395 RepID=A0A1Y1WNK1_9FUNG|nr:uncharacterized protein DL89DRAFT_273868 [Linderina pennispora]ORX74806.1 hypothetical protein DL89DRAFT_273868 [Linderina pennispora]